VSVYKVHILLFSRAEGIRNNVFGTKISAFDFEKFGSLAAQTFEIFTRKL
jgi:hypothetical protein